MSEGKLLFHIVQFFDQHKFNSDTSSGKEAETKFRE